eukprot:TRINITY_DN4_c0_g1_i2.p2 TRINITY_DN4_c0_g1~~TRINITY_DN4_c0_g1_i2.p2  ORF type:complete len:95 (-),score=36.99 TRINITY_DN4_c0_g1_i2:121-405(-)
MGFVSAFIVVLMGATTLCCCKCGAKIIRKRINSRKNKKTKVATPKGEVTPGELEEQSFKNIDMEEEDDEKEDNNQQNNFDDKVGFSPLTTTNDL